MGFFGVFVTEWSDNWNRKTNCLICQSHFGLPGCNLGSSLHGGLHRWLMLWLCMCPGSVSPKSRWGSGAGQMMTLEKHTSGLQKMMLLVCAAAKSLRSCPTLCDPIDGSPPGSLIPGILQARTLEWVAISLSNAWKWKVKVKSLSRVRLLVTPWTGAYQAPPSMGFSREEYWSGVPLPLVCSMK